MDTTQRVESLLILWDIDGTLLQPAGQGNNEYECAIRHVLPSVTLNNVVTHGKTDLQIVNEYLQAVDDRDANILKIMERLDVLSSRFDTDTGRIPALDGVNEALSDAHERGYTNGLLTGNTLARAMNKLRGAGVVPSLISWEESFFGATTSQRAELTTRARRAFPGRAMVVIGDTPSDGNAAAYAGIPFVGVETGIFGSDELSAAGAVLCIPDLTGDRAELNRVLSEIANDYLLVGDMSKL